MARVQTTRAVRIALWALLVYVVIMLLLILVRFLRIFPTSAQPVTKTAVVRLERSVPLPGV